MENNTEIHYSEKLIKHKLLLKTKRSLHRNFFQMKFLTKKIAETEEKEESYHSQDEKLFDQDVNEDEENFEIPAF